MPTLARRQDPAGPTEQTPVRPEFAEAYDAEFDGVWRYLRRLGVPEADVEDAVHDVFVVAHRRFDSFDAGRALRPWLLGIAFRVAAGWRRRGRHEVATENAGVERPDSAPAPDERAAASEAQGRLHAALERLDLPQRVVVVMHDLHEISVPDIAESLSVPLNTVYSRLRLGRAKLAAALRGAA